MGAEEAESTNIDVFFVVFRAFRIENWKLLDRVRSLDKSLLSQMSLCLTFEVQSSVFPVL